MGGGRLREVVAMRKLTVYALTKAHIKERFLVLVLIGLKFLLQLCVYLYMYYNNVRVM